MNNIYYADSSVLVKRHIAEIGSNWVIALTDPSGSSTITSSELSLVEVFSAFCRQKREKTVTDVNFKLYVRDFEIAANNEYDLYRLDSTVIAESQRLLEKHSLRAADAVQLASAVVVRKSLLNAGLQAPIFLASDNKLLDAAIAEGFTTDNPLLHP